MTPHQLDNEEATATNLFIRLLWLSAAEAMTFLLAVGLYAYEFYGPLSKKQEVWGQFGDFIGGLLNPALSLLALVALLATFSLQLREYRISARELKNSAKALADQHSVMQRQSFETSFFQLLALHNDIINSIDLIDEEHHVTKGRDCFSTFLYRLNSELKKQPYAQRDIQTFRYLYRVFYGKHQRDIGHYFQMLLCILRLIKNTNGIDTAFYSDIVRAQLSTPESCLLLYHCLSSVDQGRLKALSEEFSLLPNTENVLISPELIALLDPRAFSENL